ncbi:hypothetical protein [Pseudomonas sp. G(2018)]|uniref:hypothetical protein n=1 Tax=Pseudomonas sp. G(2018) TaxID=2502242 RepID=UPI0010F4F98D|nr:hypothetical protein [Pseudomonas sp. G(2018)]
MAVFFVSGVRVCGEASIAIAGKPAPTGFESNSNTAGNIKHCGNRLVRDGGITITKNPTDKKMPASRDPGIFHFSLALRNRISQ